MNTSELACKNEQRRNQVRRKKNLNGLDYVEVGDNQLCLTVYFLGKAPLQLEKENFRIQGGQRIVNIQVTGLEVHSDPDCPDVDDCAHITVDKFGDFSTYRLCLIEIDRETKRPVFDAGQQYRAMSGIDPRYACLDFSFKAGCPSDLDCKPQSPCPPEQRPEPPINYLAKDYASFRQVMLDRMAQTIPNWKERHIPDLGITLVELLAYAGDQLSYYQDAVATEAYLDTARRRISVRRHTRLVDYHLHEGCNARTWVTFEISEGKLELKPADFYLITDPGIPTHSHILNATELPNKLPKPYLIFEPLVEHPEQKISFSSYHNKIRIYTWGDAECCLPKWATSATLIDPGKVTAIQQSEQTGHPDEHDECCCHEENSVEPSLDPFYKLQLKPCDILIFEEVKGPKTGNKADADPSHRHAVRLTKAQKSQDPLNGQLIWEIEWTEEDALPFALCLSSIKQDDCSPISGVSVVRGNVLLVDHGESVKDDLPEVPLKTQEAECGCGCSPREAAKIAGRYEPVLPKPELTFSQPLLPCKLKALPCRSSPKFTAASAMLKQNVGLATPEIRLHEVPPASSSATQQTLLEAKKLASAQDIVNIAKAPVWEPRLELLSSNSFDPHFVVEMEDNRLAKLRFGNGESGRIPNAETRFQADYRIGNGAIGNIGAESISHLVLRNQTLSGIDISLRNPLPATGGTDPEPVDEAKLYAPQAFRKDLQRAITADDYAQIVMRDFPDQVQRAKAKLRWTGSWYEVLVAVDPLGTEQTDGQLLCAIEHHLSRYRRIAHDVKAVQATYVPLDIAMTVCVLPHYLRGHVKAELLAVFSDKTMANGDKGFFHPDNLSFGEGIYLSKLVAAAKAVTGVENVKVTKLERFALGPNQEIDNGLLPLGDFEVARLDSDPSFPENGKFTLTMRGGR